MRVIAGTNWALLHKTINSATLRSQWKSTPLIKAHSRSPVRASAVNYSQAAIWATSWMSRRWARTACAEFSSRPREKTSKLRSWISTSVCVRGRKDTPLKSNCSFARSICRKFSLLIMLTWSKSNNRMPTQAIATTQTYPLRTAQRKQSCRRVISSQAIAKSTEIVAWVALSSVAPKKLEKRSVLRRIRGWLCESVT